MKNLFLASVARNTLDIFVKSLKRPASKLKVAFIPTAGNLIVDNWFVLEDRKKLLELGFSVIDINLEGKIAKELSKEMIEIDIVFFAGGNTFYLLQEVRKSGFDKIVIEFVNQGGMYIGSSAGTLLAGPTIELAKDIDNQNEAPDLKSFDALSLIDFVILPHYDDEDFKEKIDQNLLKNKNHEYEIVTICDDQAVAVNDDSIKIVKSDTKELK